MKILIITPSYYPRVSGNAVDTERIKQGLVLKKHKVLIVTPDDYKLDKIKKFNPDIIHAFHAYKSRIGLEISKELNKPLITTITGTDINKDIHNNKKINSIKKVLEHSSTVTFICKGIKKEAEKILDIKNKTKVIMKGIPIIKETNFNLRQEFKYTKDHFLIILIGGIRPVKNNIFPIKPINKLNSIYTNIKLLFIGPILDKKYGNKLKKEVSKTNFAKYLGKIKRKDIKGVYKEANIIINSSDSEQCCNVVLESASLGIPTVVSEIQGSYIWTKGKTKIKHYEKDNKEEFYKIIKKLYEDKEYRKKAGIDARKKYEEIVNNKEIQDYIKLYKKYVLNVLGQ